MMLSEQTVRRLATRLWRDVVRMKVPGHLLPSSVGMLQDAKATAERHKFWEDQIELGRQLHGLTVDLSSLWPEDEIIEVLFVKALDFLGERVR